MFYNMRNTYVLTLIIIWLFCTIFNSHVLYACKFLGHSSGTCRREIGWLGLLWKEGGGVQVLCCSESLGPNGQNAKGYPPQALWVWQSSKKCWGLNWELAEVSSRATTSSMRGRRSAYPCLGQDSRSGQGIGAKGWRNDQGEVDSLWFGAKRNGGISKVSNPNYVSRLLSSNLDRSSKCYCHGFHLRAKEP